MDGGRRQSARTLVSHPAGLGAPAPGLGRPAPTTAGVEGGEGRGAWRLAGGTVLRVPVPFLLIRHYLLELGEGSTKDGQRKEKGDFRSITKTYFSLLFGTS